jgi:hypothetical protein
MKGTNYTIIATLGNDLERIIEANCLDDDELALVEQIIVPLFDACDQQDALQESMTDKEWDDYQCKGNEIIFPYPYFILDNEKHRDLICYIKLAEIGMELSLDELDGYRHQPDVFERNDTINLLKLKKHSDLKTK